MSGTPTFADVLVLQPELPLDLPVGIPDGAGLLEAVHCLLDVVVAKLVQQCHEISTGGGPIQRVKRIAEGWGGDRRRCLDPRGPQALATSIHTCDGQPTSEPITCQKKAVCPLATPFSLLLPSPTRLHWEMVSWLSRTWYMTDCTFQCCKRGYPDTSLKFTIPVGERTQGLSAAAQGHLAMGTPGWPQPLVPHLGQCRQPNRKGPGEGLCTRYVPPGTWRGFWS